MKFPPESHTLSREGGGGGVGLAEDVISPQRPIHFGASRIKGPPKSVLRIFQVIFSILKGPTILCYYAGNTLLVAQKFIPYNSLLRDSGMDTDDVKIKHIIKLQPLGVLFDPPASIQVSNFPGGNYLFVLHGTKDVDGFIEWEDVTDDVLASQPDSGGAGKIRLLIKAFCHRQIKIQYCRKNHRFFKLQIPNPFVCFLQTNSGLPTTL